MEKYHKIYVALIFLFSTTFLFSNEKQLKVDINGTLFSLEIAKTKEERGKGLKYRKTLETNQGMLFIFSNPQRHLFWMENCYIDLDIIFLDPNKRILSIHTMKASPKNQHETKEQYQKRMLQNATISPGNCLYAIEIKGNLSKTLSIKPGDLISFPQNF